MDPALLGLRQGGLQDGAVDAVALDVHLQGGDALGRAGDLEIHVAEVVLVTEDVGEDQEVPLLLDQAHGDARDRVLQRDARIHHRQ